MTVGRDCSDSGFARSSNGLETLDWGEKIRRVDRKRRGTHGVDPIMPTNSSTSQIFKSSAADP